MSIRLEMFAVAIYDPEAEVLTLTKELAHNKLVAARVALANFCIEGLEGHKTFTDMQSAVRELGLDVEVVAFMDA